MNAISPKALWGLLREALSGWKADNCLSMGAALAFYSLLSMGPLLVLVISLAGLIVGRDEAQRVLMTQLSGLLGNTGAEAVRNVLEAARDEKEGIFQTVLSAFILLIGATTVLGELQDDLNRIWKSTAAKAAGIWGQVRKRLLSFGLIIVVGLLLLISLAVSAAVTYMGTWFGGNDLLARALELTASLFLSTLLFAMTFKILPARRIPWGDVLLGALVTAVLFGIGKYLIGLYIGKSAVASGFGAAGTLVVVILWVYYSSQIFFVGAELTRAYSLRHGSRSADAAANSDFGGEASLVDRARRIVQGRDPAVVGATEAKP
ncbi:MAG TPA: YihY/virulence factor BrkB family protein [Usitatibacter sp.]|jgi:membrane protein|nr:YihY/virulence factor BrkB family protein [Usitatibacter sp.]